MTDHIEYICKSTVSQNAGFCNIHVNFSFQGRKGKDLEEKFLRKMLVYAFFCSFFSF